MSVRFDCSLRSPVGFWVFFMVWFFVIVVVMAGVPFTYGFAVPLFRGETVFITSTAFSKLFIARD